MLCNRYEKKKLVQPRQLRIIKNNLKSSRVFYLLQKLILCLKKKNVYAQQFVISSSLNTVHPKEDANYNTKQKSNYMLPGLSREIPLRSPSSLEEQEGEPETNINI